MERYSFLEESEYFVKKEAHDMGITGFLWSYRDCEGDYYTIFLPIEMRVYGIFCQTPVRRDNQPEWFKQLIYQVHETHYKKDRILLELGKKPFLYYLLRDQHYDYFDELFFTSEIHLHPYNTDTYNELKELVDRYTKEGIKEKMILTNQRLIRQ